MYLYHNIENDSALNIEQLYLRQKMISRLKARFLTYGYREITTPVFEKYNLYAAMNGTVNHHEMIKTIDNTGQVLVLRPDITIPLTKEIAANEASLTEDLRYFYVLDVYRQMNETKEYRQHTQAGVEYFGNPSVEADGEIIALAIHVLQDLQVGNFTIELGHAGFFKQLIEEIQIEEEDFKELKRLIQGKNIPEMEKLLARLAIPKPVKQIIESLPFLYGKLADVLTKISQLPLTDALKEKVKTIEAIYEVLEAYEVTEHLVIDLSLINHMDYYSDIIFQGFIERIGKTVLMGGRYDSLASNFNANFPAIGFAFDIDLLLAGSEILTKKTVPEIDFLIIYEKPMEKIAIKLASQLRNLHFSVLSYESEHRNREKEQATANIIVSENKITYKRGEKIDDFETIERALQFILKTREEK